MDTSKECKSSEDHNVPAETALLQNINEHASEIETEFPFVEKGVKKLHNASIKWSKATKRLIKIAVEGAVNTYLSNGAIARLSTQEGRDAFGNLVLSKIGIILSDQIMSSVPTADNATLDRSSQDHLQNTQIYPEVAIKRDQAFKSLAANTLVSQEVDESSSNQTTRRSNNYKTLGTSNDGSSELKELHSTRATLPGVRLQGSLDLSDDNSIREGLQGSEDDMEVELKGEIGDEGEATTLADPAVFTISFSAPFTAADDRFTILFNDKRVVEGLASMSAREIWQVVRDGIDHDPSIPNRSVRRPWITELRQLPDGSLAFQAASKEDLHVITTNVQWARIIRDTVSAGVETYELLLKGRKNRRIKTMMTEDEVVTAEIIDKIRKENSAAIPSLNQIGAIRDVMVLEEPGSERLLKDYAQHVLVLGSREAANTALDMGLSFGNGKLKCQIYSPGTQWHQQCSYCQAHDHTAQECGSTPICGNCGYKHLTKWCTSAKLRCANCHGEHGALSKTCPRWLETEKKAQLSYRFPNKNDSSLQIRTAAKSPTIVTSRPLALPFIHNQKPEKTLNKSSQTALLSSNPPQTARKHVVQSTASTNPDHDDTSSNNAPSALLQTVDAFRAFVLASENSNSQNPTQKKRKMQEPEHVHGYMMSGALQLDRHEGKRVRREEEEEEGPVWPMGYEGYVSPSLR